VNEEERRESTCGGKWRPESEKNVGFRPDGQNKNTLILSEGQNKNPGKRNPVDPVGKTKFRVCLVGLVKTVTVAGFFYMLSDTNLTGAREREKRKRRGKREKKKERKEGERLFPSILILISSHLLSLATFTHFTV
jgi:hypothetical protein